MSVKKFLDPETEIMDQYLNPETDTIGQIALNLYRCNGVTFFFDFSNLNKNGC